MHFMRTSHLMKLFDVSNVEEFGAKVWVLIQNKHINKLQPKAKQYIFVGLGEHFCAY